MLYNSLKKLSKPSFKNLLHNQMQRAGKIFFIIFLCSFSFSLQATPEKIEDNLLYGNQSERLGAIRYCAYARLESCYYHLIELMKHTDNLTRGEAARAIGMIGVQESIPHLAKFLEAEKDEVAIKDIIAAFGYLHNKKATEFVLPYINHKNVMIRMATARTLISIRDKSSLEKINEAIGTENDALVKTTLIHASLKINRKSPKLVFALAESIFDTRKHVRYQAAQAAYDLKLKELSKSLATAIKLEKDTWVKGALERAYYNTIYD